MVTFERANSDAKVNWLSLVGLVLIPLLVAGGFLWATWGSSTRLDRVQGAIVNLDEPVTINSQQVPLGRQLAGGLVTGGDTPTDENFSWLLTDADDAAQGLADGTYAAVVTIPKNFSRQATSYSKDNPSKVSPAQLDVKTSGVGGITDNAIAQAISLAATSTLNTELTKQYLDQIYVGFNTTGTQFSTVAKAAGDLSDGTTKLSDGIGKSADGAGQFADGLDQLDTGGKQLATGATQLGTGTTQLATGLGKLSTGTSAVATGARQLATGARQAATGADTYATGVGTAADGAKELAANVKRLSDGSKLAAVGTQQLVDGIVQYRDSLLDSAKPAALAQFCDQQGNSVLDGQPCSPDYLRGIATGLSIGATGLNDLEPNPRLRTDPKAQPKFTPKATPLRVKPADDAKTACPTIEAGQALRVNRQNPALSDQPGLLRGAIALCDGARASSAGTAQLSTGVTQFSGGIGKLETGAQQLATGVDGLADGTDKLADGLKPLAAGTKSSAAGATKLAGGARQLATGVTGISGGITASAQGADQLADGLDQLDDGGVKLADGTTKLADGLATGAEKIPSYDKTLRTRLSQTVATPVTQARPDSLFSNTALTTLLAVVALWLGGLASFLVLRAVPARVLASMKPAWRLAAEALLPAAVISAVQGVVLAAILHSLFDLGAAATASLAGLLVLAGLSFAALNQALVAWLGGVGRFLSVAAVVLTAAAATTSALPAALQGLVPFLPLTPALAGARAIATGAEGAGGAAGTLLAWLLAGTVLALIAVARGKQLPALAGVKPALSRA